MSNDQADMNVLELLQHLSSTLTNFQNENRARFERLESQDMLRVVHSDVQDTSATSQAISASDPTTSKSAISASLMRSLEKDMPLLSDDNFPDWMDHAISYSRAAGWGQGDIPDIFTNEHHESTREARDFFFNKISVALKQRIKQAGIKTAAGLYTWLNKTAALSAKQHKQRNISLLLSMRARSDESVTQFSVRAIDLRDKVILGGGTVDDDTLLSAILRGLPPRLAAAKDDVNNRDMELHEALAYLQRAETLADISDCTPDHSAMVVHQRQSGTASGSHITNKPTTYEPPAGFERHQCARCGLTGHLPMVCEAIQPIKEAYERYRSLKPRFGANRQQHRRNTDNSSGIFHSTFLSVQNTWIVDSGATSHMTPNLSSFDIYMPFPKPQKVRFGNGAYGNAMGIGKVIVHVAQGPFSMSNVLYVPSLVASLLSVKRCMQRNCSVLFCAETQTVKLYNAYGLLCEAIPNDGLLVLKTGHVATDMNTVHTANISVDPEVLKWHRKLGHLGFDSLATMASNGLFGAQSPKPSAFLQAKAEQCETCVRTKHSRNPHPARSVKAAAVCDRIHTDVSFFDVISRTGHIGFVSFIDEATGRAITRLIKRKSDVTQLTQQAVAWFETQSGRSVKSIRSDNGGEYLSLEFAAFCASKGIIHEFSAAYTPQQNGIAERFNRTIKDRVRAMLDDCSLSHCYWPYALTYACHVMNASPKAGQSDTPHKAFHGTNADMSFFHPFGCSVWVHVPREKRDNSFAPRSRKGYFLGISGPIGSKQNVVLVDKSVFVSSDVSFKNSDDPVDGRVEPSVQDIFDYIAPTASAKLPSPSLSASVLSPSTLHSSAPISSEDRQPSSILDQVQPVTNVPALDIVPAPDPSPGPDLTPQREVVEHLPDATAGTLLPSSATLSPLSPVQVLPTDQPGASALTPNVGQPSQLYTNAMYDEDLTLTTVPDLVADPPGVLHDPEPADSDNDGEQGDVQTKLYHRSTRIRKPPQFFRPHHNANIAEHSKCETFDSKYGAFQLKYPHPTVPVFIHDVSSGSASSHSCLLASDPTTLSAAIHPSNPDSLLWSNAFDSEIASLESKGVFSEVMLPPYARAIGTRPLFVTKRNGDKKVRIVAQGFSQRPGMDYTDTFAPVCRYASLRSFIALAARHGLTIRQLDVKVAFLNAKLEEKVYVKPPLGYKSKIPGSVWLLHRALYGLKQAPRAWYSELRTKLAAHGFRPTHADPCLFVKHDDDGNIVVQLLVYVDDCLVAARTSEQVIAVVSIIAEIWEVRDLGEPDDFLGIQIVRHSANSISLHQAPYIRQLCELFNVMDMAPRALPMNPKLQFIKEMGPPAPEPEQYRKLIGALIHLTNCTRPDISFSVNVLARYNQSPREQHFTAAVDLLRYVMGSSNLALTYGSGEGSAVYHDADHASSVDDRKSTSGYCVLLNGAAVSWASKKQPTVALSTMEAEYQSAALCAREVLWLRHLWPTLGYHINGPITILGDNAACLALCASHQVTAMAKHISIIHHFATEQVQLGNISFKYVSSSMNIADILTKALFRPLFEQHRLALGLRPLKD